MDTLPTISRDPVYGPSLKTTPRIIRNDFGDGYSQRAADGINNCPSMIPLEWRGLTFADADSLIAFFEAKGGHEAFYWTPKWTSTPGIWTATEWTRTPVLINGTTMTGLMDVSATFKQEFDLA